MRFEIHTDSQALTYDEIIDLLHKTIDNDFLTFFNQAERPYNCNSIESKAEVLYDIAAAPCYFSDDKNYILLQNQTNDYGTYAMENLFNI